MLLLMEELKLPYPVETHTSSGVYITFTVSPVFVNTLYILSFFLFVIIIIPEQLEFFQVKCPQKEELT